MAYDGSESSKNALRQSVRLARAEKSWIKVVAVVPSFDGDLDLTGVRDVSKVIEGPARKFLAEAVEIAQAEGSSIITNIEQGEAYEKIVDVASAENCDLIVMGRRGRGHLHKALMGSVTARVIGHTDRDVLVIPRESQVGWCKILLPTDGSKYSEAAADRAIDFAKSYGGEIAAVSVVDVTEEFHVEAPDIVDKLVIKAKAVVEDFKKKSGAAGVKAEGFVREGEAHDVITGLAKEVGAELVIMGSHGRTGIKRLLMGSVTEKVIGQAACPVLVVRS